MLVSPTGNKIRSDKAGAGDFRAPRGSRQHAGFDFICDPGQPVVAPCDGLLKRKGRVYGDDPRWSLVEIAHHGLYLLRLMYVTPIIELIGTKVLQGEVVGIAQDITKKYPDQGMTPHVHMDININSFALFHEGARIFLHPRVLGIDYSQYPATVRGNE